MLDVAATAQDGSGGAVAFIHLQKGANVAAIQERFTTLGGEQPILSEVVTAEHPILMLQSQKTPQELVDALTAQGEQLVAQTEEKKFNAWKWRGYTSLAGQTLTFISGIFSDRPRDDKIALCGFVVLNLLANASNIIFGAQKKEDSYQLQALKENFNAQIAPHLKEGESPLNPQEKRAELRKDEHHTETTGQKIFSTMQQYSTSFGEVGLRLLGATSLVTPAPKIAKAITGEIPRTFANIKNDNPATYNAGLLTLLGKFTSLASKEPDPYNPTPPTGLDKFREKITFPLSSVIEAAGAAIMAKDAYAKKDTAGAIGNLIFIGGYGIRFFAPYGSLEVNQKELHAHITDSLAKLPPEKIPSLLAETAVNLQQHFGKKSPDIASLYAKLEADMLKYHQIDVAQIQRNVAGTQESALTQNTVPQVAPTRIASPIFARDALKKAPPVAQALGQRRESAEGLYAHH
jgi:hypothetical protein